MTAATSRKKQAESSEAATSPIAVARRVFERPGSGALQIIPIAATLTAERGISSDRRQSRSNAAHHGYRPPRPSQNLRRRAPFDLSHEQNTERAFVGLARTHRAQQPPFRPPSVCA